MQPSSLGQTPRPAHADSVASMMATPASAWVLLTFTVLVYAINIADRYVLSTLLEPIKHDLVLSDTALAVLTGAPLAIFYVLASVPFGVLTDRVNRKRLTAACVTFWSAMTCLCGMSQSVGQFAAARIGVGAGEAGSTPASHSMIADSFPPAMRATAFSIWALGASIGAWLGGSGAGMLVDQYGWRGTLVIFGLLGFPVALLLLWMVREPARGQSAADAACPKASLKETLRFTLIQPSLMHVLAGSFLLTYWGWGLMWWLPSFLTRSHGLSVAEAGGLLGMMNGIGGSLAMLVTAAIMLRYRKGPEFQCRFVGWLAVISTVPCILVFYFDSLTLVKWCLWLFIPAVYVYLGPTSALLQNLVLSSMRGKIVALMLLSVNIANLIIAPILVGYLSDLYSARYPGDPHSLKYVLMGMAFTGFWGAWHYLRATRCLQADMRRAGSL